MTVYIVILNYLDEYNNVGMTENLGIFSTLENAKKCLESHVDYMSNLGDNIVILRTIVDNGIEEEIVRRYYDREGDKYFSQHVD